MRRELEISGPHKETGAQWWEVVKLYWRASNYIQGPEELLSSRQVSQHFTRAGAEARLEIEKEKQK